MCPIPLGNTPPFLTPSPKYEPENHFCWWWVSPLAHGNNSPPLTTLGWARSGVYSPDRLTGVPSCAIVPLWSFLCVDTSLLWADCSAVMACDGLWRSYVQDIIHILPPAPVPLCMWRWASYHLTQQLLSRNYTEWLLVHCSLAMLLILLFPQLFCWGVWTWLRVWSMCHVGRGWMNWDCSA